MLLSILAVSVGAAVGALLRWVAGAWLNALYPALPPGTLLVNLVGSFLVGLALPLLLRHPELGPHWRLFVITGFLGGLTTFSAFSLEVASLIEEGRLVMAALAIGAHVVGSLLMTLAGMASAEALRRSG